MPQIMTEPYPERISEITFSGAEIIVGNVFQVGLRVVDRNREGLKLAHPVAEVAVSIGPDDSREAAVFGMSPNDARAIARRLLELADEAERQTRAAGQAA